MASEDLKSHPKGAIWGIINLYINIYYYKLEQVTFSTSDTLFSLLLSHIFIKAFQDPCNTKTRNQKKGFYANEL